MKRWMLVPIATPLDPITVQEHTPVDYYGRGLYPRYINGIRPPYAHAEWRRVDVPSGRQSP